MFVCVVITYISSCRALKCDYLWIFRFCLLVISIKFFYFAVDCSLSLLRSWLHASARNETSGHYPFLGPTELTSSRTGCWKRHWLFPAHPKQLRRLYIRLTLQVDYKCQTRVTSRNTFPAWCCDGDKELMSLSPRKRRDFQQFENVLHHWTGNVSSGIPLTTLR